MDIASYIVGALALYGASVLLNKAPVYLTHKKLLAWARDPAKIKHLSGNNSFEEWLAKLPDGALERDDIQLAIEASIAGNQKPVGYLHNEKSKQPLRELGAMLRSSWSISLRHEAERRKSINGTN